MIKLKELNKNASNQKPPRFFSSFNKRPVAAIIYDFDNTLSTKDQQEFTFIPALGITAEEFWKQCDVTSHQYSMETLKAKMKEREKYLMGIPAEGIPMVDQETGDCYKVIRPLRRASLGYSVTFKK